MGTFGQSHAVAFGDHVVVITLEAATGIPMLAAKSCSSW